MAEVTIRAEQSVAGLRPGQIATVEHTPRIARLILNGRVTVVEGRPFREGEPRSEGAVSVVAEEPADNEQTQVVTGPDGSTVEVSGGPGGAEGIPLATDITTKIADDFVEPGDDD